MECPKCHWSQFIKKNGKSKYGKQRYLCKNCGKTFTENAEYNIGKDGKNALRIIVDLLNQNICDKPTIKKVIYESCKHKKQINIENIDLAYDYAETHMKSTLTYRCTDAKLLVCMKNDKINFYKIPPKTSSRRRAINIIEE